MLNIAKGNRVVRSLLILSIAAFSAFMVACEAETIVKEVEVEVIKEVIKEVPVEKIIEKEGAVRTVVEEVEVVKEIVKEVIKEVSVEVEKEVVVVATPIPVIVGEGGQRYGGILKYAAVDFGAMDPAIMGLSEGSAMYSNLTYDNLTEPWYDGSIVNRLAEEWSANEDMSVYTIDVRDGATFHDLSPLT